MPEYKIIISDVEEKALLTDMKSIQEWLENAIHNKARQVIDDIILKESNSNPAKLTKDEKLNFIRSATLETAKEKMARIERTGGVS